MNDKERITVAYIYLLTTKIDSAYQKIAERQNAKYGNRLGESACAVTIAEVLDKAITDKQLTLEDAKKMCPAFAKAEYCEYGLTPGVVSPILEKYVKNSWYRFNEMEPKLVYIDR